MIFFVNFVPLSFVFFVVVFCRVFRGDAAL